MDNGTFILIFCLIAVILMAIYLGYKLYKKTVKSNLKIKKVKVKKQKIKAELDLGVKDVNLAIIDKFMFRRDVIFWKYLNMILPKTRIACPKVCFAAILTPTGDKNTYNYLLDKFADFVIFDEQTMRPVLVIDLYDKTYIDDRLIDIHPLVHEVLKQIKLPLLEVHMSNDFDREQVKNKIFEALGIGK